jgi:hypothetical protein
MNSRRLPGKCDGKLGERKSCVDNDWRTWGAGGGVKHCGAARVCWDMNPANDLPAGNSDKGVPLSVALAVMFLILIAGAGLIWKYLYRPAETPAGNAMRVIMADPSNPRVAGGAPAAEAKVKEQALKAAAEAELADGIHVRDGGDDVLVKAGDAYMKVLRHNGQARYAFGFFTLNENEWEHAYLTQGVRRILEESEYAKELGVSEEQAARLAKLPEAPGTKWPAGDRERFVEKFKVWEAAPDKSKSAEDLVKALGDYAREKRAGDQKVLSERVKGIKAVLDERQVARINPVKKGEGTK